MKTTQTATLMNCTLGEDQQFSVVTITKDILDDKKGTPEFKKFICSELNKFFHQDMDNYDFGQEITQEDIDDCVDNLAVRQSYNIGKEDFWWQTNIMVTEL